MEYDIVADFGKVLTDELSERDFIEKGNKLYVPSDYSQLVADVTTLLINLAGPNYFVVGLACMDPCNVQPTDEIREVKGDL